MSDRQGLSENLCLTVSRSSRDVHFEGLEVVGFREGEGLVSTFGN